MDENGGLTIASMLVEEQRNSFSVRTAFYLPIGDDLIAKVMELADGFCAFLNEPLYTAHARCGEPVLSLVWEKSRVRIETPYQGFIGRLPDIGAMIDGLVRDIAADFRKEGLI